MTDPVTTLINLGAVASIAVGAVLLLWRMNTRSHTQRNHFVLGYPPERFPAHDIVSGRALTALAETQSRLLSIYEELPETSDSAQRLYTFLEELRAIMDTAYRVAIITRVYGQPAQLDQLVSEVQQIEIQLTKHVVNRLLAYEADDQEELLKIRLEALHRCVSELTPDTEMQVPLLESQHMPTQSIAANK